MKNLKIFICLILLSFSLTGCLKISTPEDMIAPPELNKEKQEMKEAVEKFRPTNSSTYPISYSDNKKMVNMIISDIDSDSSSEIISFYKNKSDDKIGMFILKKVESLWIKKFDVIFNSYEISQVSLVNLDKNDNKEIIIESYENNNSLNPKNFSIVYSEKDEQKIKIIKEIPCIVMKIYDIDDDFNKEIFTITKDTSYEDYILNVDTFNGKQIINERKKALSNINNPYDLTMGNIIDDKMAIFIESLKENGYKNTDILVFDKNTNVFTNLQDIELFKKHNYIFNLQSKDIDGDGIVELGFKIKPPNYSMPIEDINQETLVNSYFKLDKNYNLGFAKEIYENERCEYFLNIPNSFNQKYTINKSKENDDIYINFVDNSGKEFPLIIIKTIRKYDWQQLKDEKNNLQMLAEKQNFIIAGQVLDSSESLNSHEKTKYLKMRSDVLILSNIFNEKQHI